MDNKNWIEGVTKNHTIKEFSTNTFIIFQLTSVCFQTEEFHLTHLLDADDRFNHRSTTLQHLLVVQWSSVSSKSDLWLLMTMLINYTSTYTLPIIEDLALWPPSFTAWWHILQQLKETGVKLEWKQRKNSYKKESGLFWIPMSSSSTGTSFPYKL